MGSSAKIAGILGVAVVATGGCAGAYAFSDTVKNQVKLAFSSPEEYFAWVCDKNISDAADYSAAGWQNMLDAKKESGAASVSMIYTPSNDAKQMLINEMNNPDLQIVEAVNGIQSFGLRVGADTTADEMRERMSVLYNDQTLVSLDVATQMAAGNLYARIPELTERWLMLHLEDIADEMPSYEQKYSEALSKLCADPGQYISAEDVSTAVKRQCEIITSQFKNITEEKHASVALADITAEYTALTAQIDAAGITAIGDSMLAYYKNECFLRGVLVDEMKIVTAEEYEQLFAEEMSEMWADLDADAGITVTFYTDANGGIRALDTKAGDMQFFAGVGEQDEKIGAVWRVADNSEYGSKGECKVNAIRSGDAFTGTAVLTADYGYGGTPDTYAINFENLQVVNKTRGYMNGTISMDFPENDASFKAQLSGDASSQTVEFSLKLEGTDFGSVKLHCDNTAGDAVPASPDAASAFNIVDADGEFTLDGYLTEEDLNRFVEDVLKKLGADEETAEMAAEQAWEMFEMLLDNYTY